MATSPRDTKGRPYHIQLEKSQVGRVALLPGDPDRAQRIASHFRDAEELSSHREFRAFGGFVGDEYVIAMSTGIGGPSTAIAIEELARLGVKTMIRIGTCGALRRETKVGSLIIAEAAVRLDGTTRQYVMEAYPAAASPEIVIRLQEAARALRKASASGITASTDSFYVGQGRPGFRGYMPSFARELLPDLRSSGVLCFEMESSVLFTLGRLFDIRTGAVFAVLANRSTNEFIPDAGVDDAIAVAIEAVRRLSSGTTATRRKKQ